MDITITYDDADVVGALNRLLRDTQDLEPAMRDIAAALEAGVEGAFQEQKAPDGTPWDDLSEGPSPRGRGSRTGRRRGCRCSRSIPAWAGEPFVFHVHDSCFRVHPRVGGGAEAGMPSEPPARGPSPRGRGSQRCLRGRRRRLRSIPAWAGEPPNGGAARARLAVHPRVGGGASDSDSRATLLHGPSPRGRGSRESIAGAGAELGSIPAWAGEPSITLD